MYKDYIKTKVKTYKVKQSNKTNTVCLTHRLKTLAKPEFNMYRDMFYTWNKEKQKWIKQVPGNIKQLLSPQGLAYFIMGDGNFNKQQNIVRIYTNAFSYNHVVHLAEAITYKFGIITHVKHDRNNQYILVIKTDQISKLRSIIEPHMHYSMLYRIGL